MNKENAIKMSELVGQMICLAGDVLDIANNFCDAKTKNRIQRALGTAIAELDLEILEAIYTEFPELRPLESNHD